MASPKQIELAKLEARLKVAAGRQRMVQSPEGQNLLMDLRERFDTLIGEILSEDVLTGKRSFYPLGGAAAELKLVKHILTTETDDLVDTLKKRIAELEAKGDKP